jgi:hypothetical protein
MHGIRGYPMLTKIKCVDCKETFEHYSRIRPTRKQLCPRCYAKRQNSKSNLTYAQKAQFIRKGTIMKLTDFAKQVCKIEGKKINLPIAQVMEVLKAANSLLEGEIYKMVRNKK